MDKAKALCILLGKKYYSLSDLRYNAKAGYLLTKDELNDLKTFYFPHNHRLAYGNNPSLYP